MMNYVTDALREIEDGSPTDQDAVIAKLRNLGLSDFSSTLWHMPNSEFPKLSALLPPMASDEVQRSWTGSSGQVLLDQSVPFVRAVAANYADITGSTLSGKRILDYGCGYGRFLRLFRFYTDHIWGVDPWNRSVEVCQECGLGDRVRQSDYLPDGLPVFDDFHAAFAFSVFTHLSERATKAALTAVRKHVENGAVFCITIRPIEIWNFHKGVPDDEREGLITLHREKGFAFRPHHSGGVNNKSASEITYGDTSMSIEYLKSILDGWEIARLDRSLNDSYQRYVFLRAV